MKIVSIANEMAIAEIDGVRREASLMMLDEDADVGDYVLIHAGFTISSLDEEAALETIALMRDCLELDRETSWSIWMNSGSIFYTIISRPQPGCNIDLLSIDP